MSIRLLFLLAVAMDAPVQQAGKSTPLVPISPGDWVTDNDYPMEALRSGAMRQVAFRLDVDAAGKTGACHITMTSGYSYLDSAACARLMERARFRPARSSDGTPIAAFYYGRLNWFTPGMNRKEVVKLFEQTRAPFELSVTVAHLPASYKAPALLRVRFDAGGKPTACTVEQSSGSTRADSVACDQAKAVAELSKDDYRIAPRPDVRMVRATFSVAP